MKVKSIVKASNKAAICKEIGIPDDESRLAAIKVDLLGQILNIVSKRGLTQRDLSETLGKPQSRVSELLTGKLHLLSVDTIIRYLEKLGAHVEIKVRRPE